MVNLGSSYPNYPLLLPIFRHKILMGRYIINVGQCVFAMVTRYKVSFNHCHHADALHLS